MGPLLKRYSTRNVLLLIWTLRVASGMVHVVACFQPLVISEPLVFLARGLHGFTLFNLAISGTWAGIHLSEDDRKGPIQVVPFFYTVTGPSS